MTNFQNIVQAVRADVKARNLETIKKVNELLEANGSDVEIKLTKDSVGREDTIAAIGKDGGYYVKADLDESPESLVWKISNTLKYFEIDIHKF